MFICGVNLQILKNFPFKGGCMRKIGLLVFACSVWYLGFITGQKYPHIPKNNKAADAFQEMPVVKTPGTTLEPTAAIPVEKSDVKKYHVRPSSDVGHKIAPQPISLAVVETKTAEVTEAKPKPETVTAEVKVALQAVLPMKVAGKENYPELNIEQNITTSLYSKYIAGTKGATLSDLPTGEFEYNVKSLDTGWYGDLWMANNVFEIHTKPLEVDYGVGKKTQLPWLDLKLDTCLTVALNLAVHSPILFTHVNVSKSWSGDTLSLGFDEISISPADGIGWQNESVITYGLSRTRQIAPRVVWTGSAFFIIDEGGCGTVQDALLKGTFEVDWMFNKYVTFILPRIEGYYVANPFIDDRINNLVASGSLNLKFGPQKGKQ